MHRIRTALILTMTGSALAATVAVAAHPITGDMATAAPVEDSMVVSTAWLAAHLKDPNVVIIQVTHDSSYEQGHIPGARALNYMEIAVARDGLGAELPPPEQLREVFEKAGVSDGSRVVVYAAEPPTATRVLYTLDYLGHSRFSLLDGGLAQWRAEGRPVVQDAPPATRGHLTVHPRPEIVADADWITRHTGQPGVALIDTRTDGEYNGSGERHGMPSAGHLAGAHQLEWEQLFSTGDVPLLKSRSELQRLYADRVPAGDTVVTYCWVGYRASATYFVARYLGYPVKLYDGSYQDWLKRKLPVHAGKEP